MESVTNVTHSHYYLSPTPFVDYHAIKKLTQYTENDVKMLAITTLNGKYTIAANRLKGDDAFNKIVRRLAKHAPVK